jgi:GNAT acetyltransferase-like protein
MRTDARHSRFSIARHIEEYNALVIIERSRWLWRDRLIFFPTEAEVRQQAGASGVAIVNVRQSPARLPDLPGMISSGPSRTTCIDLTRDLEQLEAAMDRKSCRYEIRKAQKVRDQLTICREESPARASGFQGLYNSFVRAKGHTRPLTSARLADYARASDIWGLSMNGKLVCGHLVVRDESIRRLRLMFSATTRLNPGEEAKLCGALNRLLHWTEIEHYKSAGWAIYDFGGIGDGTDSIARFKLSFGGEATEEYNYTFTSGMGGKAYRMLRWLNIRSVT